MIIDSAITSQLGRWESFEKERSPTASRKTSHAAAEGVWTPHWSDVVMAPITFVKSIIDLIHANYSRDEERRMDAIIRLAESPLALVAGTFSLLELIAEVGYVFHTTLFNIGINKYFAGFGLALCGFEMAYEITGICRQVSLLKSLSHRLIDSIPDANDLKSIQKWYAKNRLLIETKTCFKFDDQEIETLEAAKKATHIAKRELLIHDLLYLDQNYFRINHEERQLIEAKVHKESEEKKAELRTSLTDKLIYGKKRHLANRVHHWVVDELASSLSPTLQKLMSPDLDTQIEGMKEAETLLGHVKQQARQKLLVHCLGLLALIITVIGLILILVMPWGLLPIILLNVGAAITFSRYVICHGILPNHGWTFTPITLLPNWIIYSKKEKPALATERDIEVKSLEQSV